MLLRDIVLSARRILGDMEARRWSNERMLDIVNGGLKDINKFAGVYRKEHFFELQNFRYRYPLPFDTLAVTSVCYNGDEVHLHNLRDRKSQLYATKDQLNVGVLELVNLPEIVKRNTRFVVGPDSSALPAPVPIDMWEDGIWHNEGIWNNEQTWGIPVGTKTWGIPVGTILPASAFGITVNPVTPILGVASDLTLSTEVFDNLVPAKYGLLSNVHKPGEPVTLGATGSSFGILTSIVSTRVDTAKEPGTIGAIDDKPYRIAGRYGVVTSILKKSEYAHVRYKALPRRLSSLETAFPMSPAWEEPLINWIVGTALQDDNDANNNERALLFLGRYTRELEEGIAESNKDYSAPSKKYEVSYNGGIR